MFRSDTRALFKGFPLAALCAIALMLVLPLGTAADAQDEAVTRVARQLQCPVCQGETVADSGSGLAADMRTVIRQKQAQGEADSDILSDFVASYGEGILTEPPKAGLGLGVWLGPVAALCVGIALLLVLLRQWRRRDHTGAKSYPVRVPDTGVDEEFQRFREEFGL